MSFTSRHKSTRQTSTNLAGRPFCPGAGASGSRPATGGRGARAAFQRGVASPAAALALLLGFFQPSAAQSPKADERVISSDVRMVSVNVVVLDKMGIPVSNLKEGDFRVFDNGKEQKASFFQETTQPLSILLVLDSSGSTYKKINLIKQGAVDFVQRMADLRPQDRIAVINFSDDIMVLSPFESNWREKKAYIQDKVDAMGGTSLYDSIYLCSRDILTHSPGRKVVVLYTDGIDNKSIRTFSQALKESLRTDATFNVISVDNRKQALQDASNDYYIITRSQYYEYMQGEESALADGLEPQWTANMRKQFEAGKVLEFVYRVAYERMRRLAAETGGLFHKVATYEELPEIYRRIAQETSFYYTISFVPEFAEAKEGEYHSVEIRMARTDLDPRYRKGYYFLRKR